MIEGAEYEKYDCLLPKKVRYALHLTAVMHYIMILALDMFETSLYSFTLVMFCVAWASGLFDCSRTQKRSKINASLLIAVVLSGAFICNILTILLDIGGCLVDKNFFCKRVLAINIMCAICNFFTISYALYTYNVLSDEILYHADAPSDSNSSGSNENNDKNMRRLSLSATLQAI